MSSNASLIPALDAVGDGFEKGTVFLPQLLQAATAAQAAFEAIKAKIAASGQAQGSKGKIVHCHRQRRRTRHRQKHRRASSSKTTATTCWIWVAMCRPSAWWKPCARPVHKLVGLSALMTTTVPNMQATIEALHAAQAGLQGHGRRRGADSRATPRTSVPITTARTPRPAPTLAKQLLG